MKNPDCPDSPLPKDFAERLKQIRDRKEPLSLLTHQQLEELRGKVLAVDVITGELLWWADTIKELEAMEPADLKVQWGVVAGPNPKPNECTRPKPR